MKKMKLLTVLLLGSALLLQACSGGGGGGGSGSGKSGGEKVKITWSTWGNPGELGRFQEFTEDFNKRHPDIQAELIPIPNDGYDQKILTQLSGNTAPDVFYSGDGLISQLVANGSVVQLNSYMEAPGSALGPNDLVEGLYGAAKQGNDIWGLTVDCNPMLLWFNKKVLKDSGINDLPTDLYEKGQWNWQTFQAMTEKIKAAGKYGLVVDSWWSPYYSWVTSNGGKVYDANGKFILHEDAKGKEAMKFIYDNIKAGNFTFSGSLPKGQGGDAMFMSNQLGFLGAGRWMLPVFSKNDALEYDVVPYPTNTGNKIEPAGIPTAYLVMNKNVKNKDAAWVFMSEFVNKEGQTFRLQGGGNAVPSVLGADNLVLEGNDPEHAQYFLDAREIGYALWLEEAAVPGLASEIQTKLEELWLTDVGFDAGLKNVADAAAKKIEEFKSGK
ncbi:ABC transporter substrate-binding protein [Paenibacillus thermotolerans]|uniref:ABC transporter substrate-binding protein n=1 Tax=Paenibacillus thermotolerans TaxID=3027807 RepID=UPI0023685FD6|nr:MULTISPECIES: sugar ABC transporter substrate-binding protein [unclassified Paenibacillus]